MRITVTGIAIMKIKRVATNIIVIRITVMEIAIIEDDDKDY
jgi:hypothetical protein